VHYGKMMINYVKNLDNISLDQLDGFFGGWSDPPTRETFFKLLQNSDEIILAIDEDSEKIVGFITAITDQVLAAYIPFVEILQGYQGRGIGKELVRQMLDRLQNFYMIDLLCDQDLQEFYRKMGMSKATGMMVRHYKNQSGARISDE
jgi:ribosomal protein S18 acetylase RimI-like enzyme